MAITAPAAGSFHTVAPTVTWTVNDGINSMTCTVEQNDVPVVTGSCLSSPFSAGSSDLGGGVTQWLVGAMPQFTVDATYDFIVSVDFASDPDDTKTLTIYRDTVFPTATITPIASPTNDNTPTFNYSITEANIDEVDCAVDAAGINPDEVTSYAPCGSNTTFTPSTPVGDGPRAFYVRVTDGAGHIGYATPIGFVVDTVAPTINVTSPQPNQVMQSSVPELSFGAVDPDPGTGVSTFNCRYDADAFTACNDVAFVSKNLAHGAHSLTIQATDGASNTATTVIPFSVDTELGPDAPAPGRATFKKKSGKRAGRNYKLVVTASFVVPAGLDPATACKGKVRLSITGRLRGKKSKTYTKQPNMQVAGRTCVATGTFTIPRAYKGKKLTTKLIFRGNTVFGGFQRNGSIKKA